MSMPMALKDLEKSIMESAKAVQIQIDVEAEKIRQGDETCCPVINCVKYTYICANVFLFVL